ncbi:MAG: hypothetical protein Q7J21_10090 [Rugosibacter sp.]|nr:hypothetical protein [Rugosibacter sp.]
MNKQSIPEQPVELTENTVEKIAESAVENPVEIPVKRSVRKSVASSVEVALDVSAKASVEAPIEKQADSPLPEASAAEPAPFAPVLSMPDPVPVARAIQPTELKPAAPTMPDPRRRLRELLAIPDRDRTDALWDELIELEIQLAPGNRVQSPNADANVGRHQKPSRFAEPGRRPASSPNAGRHHRPNGAHGSALNVVPGGPGAAAPYGAGGADAPRPAKRFFKKPRRGPRPPDKV